MSGKEPNQAMGGAGGGAGDRRDPVEEPAGWSGGGESGGGERPSDPKGGADGSGSPGHGGQSHIAYSGTGDDDGEHNENAATGAD